MSVPPRVVLVGPPGAGKSTIGRKLARELGVELYDTDAAIEQQTGRSIPEIFADDGEAAFRRIEERVVRRAVRNHPGVVSLGGGAVLSEKTRQLLRGRTVVYLEIGLAEGLRRTGTNKNRPLLAGADPTNTYRDLLRRRRPLYREVASIRVRTDGRSPGRVVRAILTKLSGEPAPSPTPPNRPRRGNGTPNNHPADTSADAEPHQRRRPRRRRPRQPKQPSNSENFSHSPDRRGQPAPGEGRSRRARARRARRTTHTQPPDKSQQTSESPRTSESPQSESEPRP